jgi:Uma2 family endonuclease
MSVPSTANLLTTDELLAMPENGVERELIRGELRERPMTRRSRLHTRTEARTVALLDRWMSTRPEPHGEILSGEAGCILRRDPDTTVGIDVAYLSPEMAARQSAETTLLNGPPLLAVEILSPSDKQEEIDEKVEEYLAAGVAIVWVINPRFRTVTVFRTDAEPELFNVRQVLSAEPHLPGFQVPVAEIFSSK